MKILVHDPATGSSQEHVPLFRRVGPASRKQAIQTNDEGYVDPSFLRTTIGNIGDTVFLLGETLDPTVTAGMQVVKHGGIWVPALSDGLGNVKQGMCFNVTLGAVILYGIFDAPAHNLVVNATYYLSPTQPGQIQLVAPILGIQQACLEVLDADTLKVIDQAVSGAQTQPISLIDYWTDLLDTPSFYTGFAGWSPEVNINETAITFRQKADLTGNPTINFRVADATLPNEAVNLSQLTQLLGGLQYMGTWTPNGVSYPDETLAQLPANQGKFWICDADGTDKDARTWVINDWIIFNGSNSPVLGAAWDQYSPYYGLDFLGLRDTPNTYTGFAGEAAVVNAAEDGLEFAPVSADRIKEEVNIPNHGFVIGDLVYRDGAIWDRAIATGELTLSDGLVTEVPDVNNFTITYYGIATLTNHGMPVNSTAYLSATTLGGFQATPPVNPGEFVQAVFEAVDINTVKVIDHAAVENVTIPAVSAGIPDWERNTAYLVGDYIRYVLTGTLYRCTRDHTSSLLFIDDWNAGDWENLTGYLHKTTAAEAGIDEQYIGGKVHYVDRFVTPSPPRTYGGAYTSDILIPGPNGNTAVCGNFIPESRDSNCGSFLPTFNMILDAPDDWDDFPNDGIGEIFKFSDRGTDVGYIEPINTLGGSPAAATADKLWNLSGDKICQSLTMFGDGDDVTHMPSATFQSATVLSVTDIGGGVFEIVFDSNHNSSVNKPISEATDVSGNTYAVIKTVANSTTVQVTPNTLDNFGSWPLGWLPGLVGVRFGTSNVPAYVPPVINNTPKVPTDDSELVNKLYVDGGGTDSIARDDSRPPTTDIDWGDNILYNLAAPTANKHAATKQYVDNSVPPPGTFLNLTDTPGNYGGDAGKVLTVNSAETAVIFADPPAGSPKGFAQGHHSGVGVVSDGQFIPVFGPLSRAGSGTFNWSLQKSDGSHMSLSAMWATDYTGGTLTVINAYAGFTQISDVRLRRVDNDGFLYFGYVINSGQTLNLASLSGVGMFAGSQQLDAEVLKRTTGWNGADISIVVRGDWPNV